MWKSIVAMVAIAGALAAFVTGLSIAAGIMSIRTEE